MSLISYYLVFNMDLQQRIQKAKQLGYSDEEINARLQQRGLLNDGAQQSPNTSTEPSFADLPGNILPSAQKNLGTIFSAITNPLGTAANLGGLGMGAVEKIIPGKQDEEKYVDSLIGFYKDRYGGAKNLKKTIIEDPTGFLLDLSTVLGGGGALLKGAGNVSKISALERAGETASTLSKITDPLQIPGKAAGMTGIPAKVGELTKDLPANVLDRYVVPAEKGMRENEVLKKIIKDVPRLGDKIASNTKIPITPSRLIKLAQSNIDSLGPKIEKIIDINKDTQIHLDELLAPFDELRSQFGNSLEGNELTNEIDRITKKISGRADKRGYISVEKIYEMKKNQDKITGKYYQTGKALSEIAPTTAIKMASTNYLRDALNNFVPGLSDINEKYSLWRSARDAAVPVATKGMNYKLSMSDLFFGGAGFKLGGIPGAIGGLIGRRIITSPTAGMTTARLLQEIVGGADKLNKATKGARDAASKYMKTNYMLNRENSSVN